ncbi:hypothetical protein ACKWTF_008428 [Chironomus riparius]
MKLLVLLLIAEISISFGLEFHCEFKFSQNYGLIGSVYQCKTSNPNFGLSDPVLYKISGNPTTGFTHRDVKLVEIDGAENLIYIPQDMSNPGLFPNLIALKMSNTGLKHLSGTQLNDYRNLMWLSLSNNQIIEVPDDFFQFTTNLRFIDFNSNSISIVGFDALTPINHQTLVYVGFKNNTCIDKEYSPMDGNFYSFLYDLQYDCQFIETTPIPTTSILPPTEPPTYPPPTFIPTNPTPSTTASPNCQNVDIGEEVCKLNHEIRNLAQVIEKRDQVSQKYEDVLLYVQETLKNINKLLNNKFSLTGFSD